ncbi:MAG: hypothetical protein ACR2NA_11440 [Solirubrobacterales bacterium]
MSACPSCDRENVEDHDFCQSCGTYLRWEEAPEQSDTAVLEAVVLPSDTLATFEEPPPPAPTPAGQPAVREPEPDEGGVREEAAVVTLRLPDDASSGGGLVTAPVDAGGEVELIATVRNESEIVDGYDLRITGVPEGWWTVEPAVVYLVPFGAESGSYEQEVTVRLHPPRRPEAKAGPWWIRLVAMSHARKTKAGSAGAELVIAAYEQLESRVAPEHGHGERSAQYAVPVRSGGNAPLPVSFRGEDPDWEMSFAFDPPALTLAPGREAVSTVTVSAERLGMGSERERPFTVYVKGGEQALAGTATFVQRSSITRARLIVWRIAVTLLAAAMLIGGSFMSWADHPGGSPPTVTGICLRGDPAGCLRVDHFLSVADLGGADQAGSTDPLLLNLVTSLGFFTVLTGMLVLLGIRTGKGTWVTGSVAVIVLVVFLFAIRGQAESKLGAWVTLLGGLLALAAGAMATASRKSG